MTVLHLLKRDGQALCGEWPRPQHITGEEPECESCEILRSTAGKPVRRAEGPGGQRLVHGLASTFHDHGCRCLRCRRAVGLAPQKATR